MTKLRVLFWDVRNGGDGKLALIERIDADVVLLLAVSRTSARNWSQRWQGHYHCAAALDTVTTNQKRPHGAMIASRWPLQQAEPITELARPERGLIATTDLDARLLTLISWGTPNTAGEGYPVKMAAYRHMTSVLAAISNTTILGVDTNSRYDPPDPTAPEQPDELRADEHAFLRRAAGHHLHPPPPRLATRLRRRPRPWAGSQGPAVRVDRGHTARLRAPVPRSTGHRRRPRRGHRRPRATARRPDGALT